MSTYAQFSSHHILAPRSILGYMGILILFCIFLEVVFCFMALHYRLIMACGGVDLLGDPIFGITLTLVCHW